jgi:hypothetical protein
VVAKSACNEARGLSKRQSMNDERYFMNQNSLAPFAVRICGVCGSDQNAGVEQSPSAKLCCCQLFLDVRSSQLVGGACTEETERISVRDFLCFAGEQLANGTTLSARKKEVFRRLRHRVARQHRSSLHSTPRSRNPKREFKSWVASSTQDDVFR